MTTKIDNRDTVLEVKFEEYKHQNSNEHKMIIKKIEELGKKIDQMPNELMQRFDDRYAKKESETQIKELEKKVPSRSKTTATLVSAIVSLAGVISAVVIMIVKKVL